MPATGEWFSCDVLRAGAAEEDSGKGKKSTIYIRLRDRGGAFPSRWYTPVEVTKQHMLATALAAISTGLPADALLESRN